MALRTKSSPNNRALAEEFAVLLTRKGWTYEQLSEKSGLDAAQCGRLLRNQATFDADDIIALSGAFGVNPVELFDRAIANVLVQ